MEKEDQDFSKVESKFKLSLLQVEKRFLDLETVVSEVSEKLKDVDLTGVSEIKQRIDDIEDLIMVEQAAIIELKNMLENLPKPEAPAVDLSGVESKIAELQQKTAAPVEKVDMQPVMDQINALKQQVDQKIQEFSVKVSSLIEEMNKIPDSAAIESNLKEIAETFKAELKAKSEQIDKSIAMIEERLKIPLPEITVDELKNMKNEWLLNKSRIDVIEKFVQQFGKEINELRAFITKFETFEKIIDSERITDLSTQLSTKFEEFKVIEEEVRRLPIMDSINNIKKELDKQNLKILDRVKKDEIKDLTKVIEQNAANVSFELEKKYKELAQRSAELDVVKKKDLENWSNSIYKELRNKLDAVQMKDFVKKGDLQNIYKNMKDLDSKLNYANNKVRQVKTDEILKLMEVLKKDIDGRLNALKGNEDSLVDEVVKHTELGFDEMDYRIQTLLDKIVYLETRMAAMEKMLEDTRIPIIIE